MRRQLLDVLRLYISVALQQKTANFKVAILSRQMQWGASTEIRQKNQLAQTEIRFIKTTINNNNTLIVNATAITRSSSPLYQRCTSAKDGKLQGGHSKQSNAVASIHCRKAKESTCTIMMTKINEGQKGWREITIRLAC